MIRTLVASTTEVDDITLAVKDIMSQLNPGKNLLKNTVGIVACHYEFITSGMVKEICNTLPFDTVGTISNAQAIPGAAATLIFSIMVITSDTIEFVKAITEPLNEEPNKKIINCYRNVKKDKKPSLILTFAPFMLQNSGDEYIEALAEATENTPCFGTLAVDDTNDFSNCFTIDNGEHYPDKMILLMIYGNINPKFYIANISNDKIFDKAALITKSHRHTIMEVNNRPIIDFLKDVGLAKASETQYAMSSLPFLLDYNDGTPPVAKIFMQLSEEKYAICAGNVPEGSTLYLCSTDREDVLFTTGQAIETMIKDIENASGVIIYSCISRIMAMGGINPFGEMNLINEKLNGKINFLFAHSGGEICPTQISNTKAINRFHNNTLVICLF